ncbi:hypothetical protein BGZ63DRAFT_370609 [Mariannaea sp. PMI_226]|nr:hypothetical protein BGZ63DRAFT_370609 [Mariannaea sp. PMI_226]
MTAHVGSRTFFSRCSKLILLSTSALTSLHMWRTPTIPLYPGQSGFLRLQEGCPLIEWYKMVVQPSSMPLYFGNHCTKMLQ